MIGASSAAEKPYATWLMGAVSFAESSFFPVPPDVMLVPMSLARPDRAYYYAAVCTITSVAGGVLGYLIGALLYDSRRRLGHRSLWPGAQGRDISRFLSRIRRLDHPAQGPDADPLQGRHDHGGIFRLQHLAVHSVFGHYARRAVFLFAFLMHRYGAQAREIIEKRLGFWVAVSAVTIVAGFVIVAKLI